MPAAFFGELVLGQTTMPQCVSLFLATKENHRIHYIRKKTGGFEGLKNHHISKSHTGCWSTGINMRMLHGIH